jgi:hypothetical protein
VAEEAEEAEEAVGAAVVEVEAGDRQRPPHLNNLSQ